MQQTTVSLSQLLKEEVREANILLKSTRERLEPIYLAAGEKLIKNGLLENKSQVSVMLAKTFGPEHERNIQRWLPADWKRFYTQQESDDAPRNLEEEVLKLTIDVFKDMVDSLNVLYKKVREEPIGSPKYDTLMRIVTEQFRNSAELKKRIDELKNISVQLSYIKELQDERRKIGDYEKMMLKIQLLFYNKDHVAKKFGLSSKWIKNGIERNIELDTAFEKIGKCHKCFFNIAEYYRTQKKRQELGLPLQELPILQHYKFSQ